MPIDPSALQENYRLLAECLRPMMACWNQSVIQDWPVCRDALPAAWWEPLLTWPDDELYALDEWISSGDPAYRTAISSKVPDEFNEYMQGLQALIQFPSLLASRSPSAENRLRMTAKKQHEISCLLPFIETEMLTRKIARGLDIGGGAGHLARTLVTELSLPMISIDRDPALQNLGRDLLKKQGMEEGETSLRFLSSEVMAGKQQDIDAYFQGSCLSLGLHTCGPLAWTHLFKSSESLCLLNFGCCYDRMTPERDCHQSLFAKQHRLPITSFALFLATRGRRRKPDELLMQERVNSYRLALHVLLQEEGLSEGFMAVGDAARSTYLLGFAAYAEDRMKALGWVNHFSAVRAQRLVERPGMRRAMREFFLINMLRNCFARPLEVLLLLDRALWLCEQGREVSLLQFFDQRHSPRNLGLFAAFPKAIP